MNYTKKILNFTLIGLTTLSLVACAGKPIAIKSSSPQLYENTKDKGREITASASGFQLLLFIPIGINDRHVRAHQLLKDKADGDYITDVKIKESWSYGFIGTFYTTTLTATSYPSNKQEI